MTFRAVFHKNSSTDIDVTDKIKALYDRDIFRVGESCKGNLTITYVQDGQTKVFETDSSYIANEYLNKYTQCLDFPEDVDPIWNSYIKDIHCISSEPKSEIKNISRIEIHKKLNIQMFQALQFKKIPILRNNRFPSVGQYGCSMSHYSLVKLAMERDLDNIMILEDDCIFHKDFNFYMNQAVEELKGIYWDILYCHWNPYAFNAFKVLKTYNHIQRVTSTSVNHCWVINKCMYKKFIGTLDAVLASKARHYPIINNQIYKFDRSTVLMTTNKVLTTQCPKKSSLSLNMAVTNHSEDFLV